MSLQNYCTTAVTSLTFAKLHINILWYLQLIKHKVNETMHSIFKENKIMKETMGSSVFVCMCVFFQQQGAQCIFEHQLLLLQSNITCLGLYSWLAYPGGSVDLLKQIFIFLRIRWNIKKKKMKYFQMKNSSGSVTQAWELSLTLGC